MTDERIISYLLKELPEEELQQFEDECFAQESWPPQIGMVEGDLIDAYLRDELTQEQRQHFEQNYSTTEARQERILLAAALLRQVDERQPAVQATASTPSAEQAWFGRLRAFWSAQVWPLRAAAALAAVIAIAFALWLSVPRTRSPQTFATLTLTISNNTRAAGARVNKVNLPLNADALRISLTLPEQPRAAARYRVELENLDNDKPEAKTLEVVGQDAQFVTAVIPAAQLTPGRYTLKLFAVEGDGYEQRIEGSYFLDVQ